MICGISGNDRLTSLFDFNAKHITEILEWFLQGSLSNKDVFLSLWNIMWRQGRLQLHSIEIKMFFWHTHFSLEKTAPPCRLKIAVGILLFRLHLNLLCSPTQNQLSALVVRVSEIGRSGFNPRPSHTTDYTNGILDASGCLKLQKQEVGSWSTSSMACKGFLTYLVSSLESSHLLSKESYILHLQYAHYCVLLPYANNRNSLKNGWSHLTSIQPFICVHVCVCVCVWDVILTLVLNSPWEGSNVVKRR